MSATLLLLPHFHKREFLSSVPQKDSSGALVTNQAGGKKSKREAIRGREEIITDRGA
jgi:hypothetical protein